MFAGQINIRNETGDARLSFPVSGPTGSGTVFAEAEVEQGRWRYDVLIVRIQGRSERIDISDKPILRQPDRAASTQVEAP